MDNCVSNQKYESPNLHFLEKDGWRAAKKLKVDYAKAMTGFGIQHYHNVPVFDGIVVCSEYSDAVNELCDTLKIERIEKEEREEREEIYGFWKLLIEGIIVRRELEAKRRNEKHKRKTHSDFLQKDASDIESDASEHL